MTGARVELGVLGPSIARIEGTAVTLSAQRLRSLLGVLVLWRGQTVPAERIIDVLWDGRPSPGASNTLQGYVANVRRLLEPHRQPRAAAEVLVHEPGGYRLSVGYDQIDAGLFEATVAAAQDHLRGRVPDPTRPPIVADGGSLEELQQQLQAAMTLWRGDAYADLEDFAPASAERRRLEELRVDARTASVVMDMALGRSAGAAATLEELVSSHPLREQLWGLWAVALVRSDRQAHALEVLGRLRATLADELGIDPSPSINQLQEDILQQDLSVLGGGTRPRPSTETTSVETVQPRTPQSVTPHLAPLIGRDRELAQLQDTLSEVVAGTARHCMVVGEAGVGKSRLSAEFVRWAVQEKQAIVATARSVDTDGAPPLWALTRALTDLSERTGIALPDIGRAAEEMEDEAAAAGRFALTAALSDFLQDVARVSPVLLVVEDAHWSDPTSLRVLRHVVDHALDVPLMILINRRPEGATTAAADLAASITRSGGLWLQLDGLDPDRVGELARHLAGEGVSGPALDLLHERTGGNPLYVTELLRAHGQVAEELPPSLAGLVRRRLAALPADTVRALEIAAIVGRRFSAGVVARVWGDEGVDDLAGVLEHARAAGILRERSDGTWLFTHALVRDAVLEGIRPAVRGTWHARVARSLEDALGDPSARGQVAWHWREAGAQYARHAWMATALAAERAQGVYAFQEEAQLLAAAIEAQRIDVESTDVERFVLLERRAVACRHASDWDGAAVAVIEAIAVAERMNRPQLAARAATSLGEGSIWHVQRYGTVAGDLVHALHRSLALIDPADTALRCRVLLSIAMESFYISPSAELDALVEEALEIAAQQDDDELTCLALQQAFSARWRPETIDWRLDAAARALH
jgi:DNA-binding SARP family transcriptional activator